MDPIRNPAIRTVATALVVAAAAAHAAGTDDRDCTPSAVQVEVDGQPLTREEKIARLDEALRESLARFDECQTAVSAAAGEGVRGAGEGVEGARDDAAGDDGGGSGAVEDGDDAETAETGGVVESVAARGVQGTEGPEDAAGTTSDTERPPGSGGAPGGDPDDVPDDIPEPDNDSVLEAQIRRAAMEETDPKIRAELWNEYRKYKGLPPRPLPDDDGERSDAQSQ